MMAVVTLPADLTPGLLEGWRGPVLIAGRECVYCGPKPGSPVLHLAATSVGGWRVAMPRLRQIHISLAQPEVRDHLIRWASAGAADPSPDCLHGEARARRLPCDLGWARDLPDALSWAVRRVVGGLPVLGEVPAWVRCDDTSCWHRGWRAIVHDWEGWTSSHGGPGHRSGPETGAAGRSLVDADLSERGWWLGGGIFALGGEE